MKKLIFPDVPKKFDGKVPAGFVNDVRGWTFSRQEVLEAARAGKILTMDIDMAGHGACSCACGHCYRRNKGFFKEERFSLAELSKHLKDAKDLGLRSVKVIGPGEPLEDRALFPFLELLVKLDIIPMLFTKAHVLGDDELCKRIHFMDGQALVKELKGLGVSILAGATSFDPETEDSIVGKKGYHAMRAKAMVRLAEAGFNEFIPGVGTRFGMIFAPITPANVDEAFDAYRFARERNIQPVMGPTMVAGRALDKLKHLIVEPQQFIDLYTKINIYSIQSGIITLEELQAQGISAYAGGAPCNQIAVGVFMRGDGKVLRCPGNDVDIQGDLRVQSLREIWEQSENRRKFPGDYNNFCPPKEGISFPKGFFQQVLQRVRAALENPE